MGMTPFEFFEAFVLGNYNDCLEHPGCVRRAFNAAISASHLADHFFAYFQKNDPLKISNYKHITELFEDLSKKTNGCFRDIRSISNAYKHLYTSANPKRAAYSTISSTGSIESIRIADEDSEINEIKEEFPDILNNGNRDSTVIFSRKDGQQIEFLPVLKKVVEYWERILN